MRAWKTFVGRPLSVHVRASGIPARQVVDKNPSRRRFPGMRELAQLEKSATLSGERKPMNTRPRLGFMIPLRDRVLVWACGGLALVLIHLFGQTNEPKATPQAANPILVASNSLTSISKRSAPWYLRSGQWRADMRSVSELLRYLLDSEQVAETNSVPIKAADA